MQNNLNRAKQFLPFDALKGFREILQRVDNIKEDKKDFFDDFFDELNDKLKQINKGDKVIIEHYYNLEYIETIGIVKKIDIINKYIYISDSKIFFDSIIDIKLL